ncbi:hypothetical protein [Alteromonas sp. a30]|uniref:hypothetical protein n=1 Tax=Alteromonas sp. a30 TaxID=2730917 RepID=UPI002280C673|nr:hypothetical protein [Alteromonas sp. a30]MCY7294692.1 hypothetical protein [Alteromonas sp. a30]
MPKKIVKKKWAVINRIAKKKWIEKLRIHLCIACVGGSTLRSQSTKGQVDRCRDYLKESFELKNISNLSRKGFLELIDSKTIELSEQLPNPKTLTPNWGAARKVINIYLRLCAMNKDINDFYNLSNIEEYLEVPLDSQIVKRIKANSPSGLPSGEFKIIHLVKNDSDKFQRAAKAIARKERVHRYELDVLYWNT